MTAAPATLDMATLLTSSLPPRPKILIAVTQEAEKPNANLAVIAKLIAEDVSISAAVLKIINSPAFRRPSAISSIEQAINLLGLKRVMSIVITVAVREAIKTKYNLEDFWQYGAAVGTAGAFVAQYCKKNTLMDDAYTLGLFHDACAAFLMNVHEDYFEFFKAGNAEGWIESYQQQQKRYGTTHALLGAVMAQAWCFPQRIVMAIFHLHTSNDAFERSHSDNVTMTLLAILKCAREIARFYHHNQTNNPEWQHAQAAVLEFLGMDEQDFMEMREVVLEKMDGL